VPHYIDEAVGSPHPMVPLLRFLPDCISVSASPTCAHMRTNLEAWIHGSVDPRVSSITTQVGPAPQRLTVA
jgi:hypothetical protein